jgi:ankyrin repeat protein
MSKQKKPSAQQFYAAICKHDIAQLRKLLAQGGDPNCLIKDAYHGTRPILLDAAGAQFFEGVKILMGQGADPNLKMSGGTGASPGATPLHAAIYGSDPRKDTLQGAKADELRLAMVDFLLTGGADPNAIFDGQTPLCTAAVGGNLDICKRLIKAGAKWMNLPEGVCPPLISAATVPLHGVPECIPQEQVAKLLLALGAPVDDQTDKGLTALMVAAARGNERLIELFLRHGADVNHRSQDGYSPFLSAAAYARDTFGDDERELAIRIFNQLLDAGADPLVRDSEGNTAYDIASRFRPSIAADYIKQMCK